jgi:hypothetical protein
MMDLVSWAEKAEDSVGNAEIIPLCSGISLIMFYFVLTPISPIAVNLRQ